MKFSSFVKIIFSIALVFLFITVVGCDPYQKVTFDNQTPYPIKVVIDRVPLDYSGTPNVTWNTSIEIIDIGKSQAFIAPVSEHRSVGKESKYTVIAINQANEVLFSKIYTWDELHDMNWTVVIK